MASLASAEEEDAAEGEGPRRPSVPSPSPAPRRHRHRHHRPRPTVETVINGTTWFHSPPSPRHFTSDLQPPNPPPARYDLSFPLNFDGPAGRHPAVQRPPHLAYLNDGAFGHGGMRPPVHVIPPSMPFNYMPDYAHGAPCVGVFPGPLYPGMSNMCGSVPGYPCNNAQQNQLYFPYDGHARPYMLPTNPVYMPYPNSGVSQEPPLASHGQQLLPPHPIPTAGKTLRRIITWSGMTMPVTVTSQAAAMVEWIQKQAGDLFGFDVEWKPNRYKDEDNAVALLQICGPTDCLIIQLLYTDTIPRMLREFLSNARKQLGGVGIRQDVVKLEKDHDLVCQGQVELGALASEKLQRSELRGTGLKTLVQQVLGMTLVKWKKITLSNWEKEDLDDKQIEYACIDAWAAYAILHKLVTL